MYQRDLKFRVFMSAVRLQLLEEHQDMLLLATF